MNKYKDYIKCSWYIVKHPQLNATTNLYGGRLLDWIDESTAIFASTYMGSDSIVTARFGGLSFSVPVELGKVVTIWAKAIKEGKSSLTVEAVATKRSMGSQREIEVAKTELVFVSLDIYGKPLTWKPKRFD